MRRAPPTLVEAADLLNHAGRLLVQELTIRAICLIIPEIPANVSIYHSQQRQSLSSNRYLSPDEASGRSGRSKYANPFLSNCFRCSRRLNCPGCVYSRTFADVERFIAFIILPPPAPDPVAVEISDSTRAHISCTAMGVFTPQALQSRPNSGSSAISREFELVVSYRKSLDIACHNHKSPGENDGGLSLGGVPSPALAFETWMTRLGERGSIELLDADLRRRTWSRCERFGIRDGYTLVNSILSLFITYNFQDILTPYRAKGPKRRSIIKTP